MSDVVFLARDGEDVRLQVLSEPPILDAERLERTAMALAGHRGHEPDRERDEPNEGYEDGELDAESRELQ